MAARTDLFQSPDYYLLDELLTEEHLMIRDAVRNYVKKEISPIIEDYAQRAEFPQHIVRQMGELGCFGPTVPAEYGGGGLDYISYGLMMQELERGDSGVRSTASAKNRAGMAKHGYNFTVHYRRPVKAILNPGDCYRGAIFIDRLIEGSDFALNGFFFRFSSR